MKTKRNYLDSAIIVGLPLCLALIWLSGCAPSGPLRADGMPRQEYLVGGGMEINWIAPEEGTAYLVMSEKAHRKMLRTTHLKAGEAFELSVDITAEEFKEKTGAKLADAVFRLYFVPGPAIASAR